MELLRACLDGDLRAVTCVLDESDVCALHQEDEVTATSGEVRLRTPLAAACDGGSVDVVALLLEKRADMHQVFGSRSLTAMYVAAQEGRTSVVEHLLAHRANVNQENGDGRSPLFGASQEGHDNVVEVLLAQNAAVNSVNKQGWAPLSCASMRGHQVSRHGGRALVHTHLG